MNKILMTAAESALRSGSYVSPEAKISEMHSEGVLCASVQGASFEEWNEGTLQW